MPFQLVDEDVEPVYETLPGWKNDITGVRNFSDMPEELKSYIRYIEEKTGVPIKIVSVGPDRKQTIID